MNNKRKGLLGVMALMALAAVVGGYILREDRVEAAEKDEINNELTDQERLDAETQEYAQDCYEAGVEARKGEYKDCVDSREANTDFITGEFQFRQIYSQTEIEFLGYEELEDLSEYFEDVTWDGNEVANYSRSGLTETLSTYIDAGLINKDGTLNNVTQKIRVRYDDRSFGTDIQQCERKKRF